MRQGHNHELALELGDTRTLPEYPRHGLIVFGLAYAHLLWVFAMAENIIALESLARVGYHVTLHADLIIFLLLHAYSYELRDLWAAWMVDNVLLLKSSAISHLVTCQDALFLIQGSENVSDALELQASCYHVNSRSKWIFQLLYALELTNLWRLIYRFNIYSDTVGEVGILRVIAVQVAHALLVLASALPCADELGHFFEIHE